MEDGSNNFRKTICEVADGALEKIVQPGIERRRSLYKNYLSERSYESKKNDKKLEKTFKYEPRRCEVKAMGKIAEDLEDAAKRYNVKILYWHANKLRGKCES